jgi:hypothetical protein
MDLEARYRRFGPGESAMRKATAANERTADTVGMVFRAD